MLKKFSLLFNFINFINRYLHGSHHAVAFGREANDVEHLIVLVVGESLLSGKMSVTVDTVFAVVHDRHGEINQLFRDGIERTITTHDFLGLFPVALERLRVVGLRTPGIADEVGVARLADVVEHRLGFG